MLNVADTCTRYIVPKLREAGWGTGPYSFNEQQLVQTTDGRIIVAGTRVRRKAPNWADYLLEYTRDFTIAVVEAKAAECNAGDGMQQAKEYVGLLGLRFAYDHHCSGQTLQVHALPPPPASQDARTAEVDRYC